MISTHFVMMQINKDSHVNYCNFFSFFFTLKRREKKYHHHFDRPEFQKQRSSEFPIHSLRENDKQREKKTRDNWSR